MVSDPGRQWCLRTEELVLILVVMEYGLRLKQILYHIFRLLLVLILVVMEYGLRL